jgi:HTH-type transcriptional regulator/antitoxin HigA
MPIDPEQSKPTDIQDANPKPSPGDAIKAELARRGWTHEDLARVMGRHRPEITSLISGKRSVTPELSVDLSAALTGTTAEYWLDLEASRQLDLLPHDPATIRRRVRMYELAPIADMEKRGWIRSGLTDDQLEAELCRFFGINALDQEPEVLVAARKTDRLSTLNSVQRAWCCRARQLAAAAQAKPFSPSRLDAAERRLRQLAAFPKEARHVAETMREYGIRFVVVEPLPGGKIDGAAFWLSPESPAIAVSIRHDRVDSFWFTVMHEFKHIRAGDAISVDDDLSGEDFKPPEAKSEMERRADEGAAAALVPTDELSSFIRRVGPLYSKDRIVQFAHRIKMHPGIIVGQLQHRKEIGYSANREMLVKVREIVTDTALTDGFGRSIAPGIV